MSTPSRQAFYIGLLPVLQEGSRSSKHIGLWQQFLVNQGYGIAVDGLFGPHTKTATIAFQIAVGLPATGIVNRNTWAAKVAVQNAPRSPGGAAGAGQDVISETADLGETFVEDQITSDTTALTTVEEMGDVVTSGVTQGLSTEMKIGIGVASVFGLGLLWAVVRR